MSIVGGVGGQNVYKLIIGAYKMSTVSTGTYSGGNRLFGSCVVRSKWFQKSGLGVWERAFHDG